ncbi:MULTISPECIES: CAP domain-containing protein [Ruminococcus]|uniref:SCP-like extracellular n=1 Tax=Ruminococcus albus (strain ATCC 27210 / DSM 20455 / JCM 14654 / NCDO 2250 / 7) TaxID=697329 RepID=E6UGJ1_RUMA7|nr:MULTISPECIES: CAP domain-containing protein [Ruminococcus]ADU23114.1 SCP-like extracellular [Ruminococcus albus 7 = DSM 20455]MCR5022691.1 serine protease [Ruminococcus sp.]
MVKKIIALAAAAVMSVGCISASAATYGKVDINLDGKVNVTDLSMLSAYIKGKKAIYTSVVSSADLNRDGRVNVTDISMLASYVKGGTKARETTMSQLAKELAVLVNNERRSRGLTAYVYSSELSAAASKRAQEISKVFDHKRPDGRDCFTVLPEYGISITSAGENIAYGQDSPKSAFNGFMNSAPHRSSILDANKKYLGVGVYRDGNGTLYWVQLFASGSGMSGSQV